MIRPAKLWNDTESAPDAGWLVEQLDGAARWAAACGSVPVAAFTITKLSWLHRSEPEHWSRVAQGRCCPTTGSPGSCAGEFVTDRGDASGTGYWSPAAREYRWDLLGDRRRASGTGPTRRARGARARSRSAGDVGPARVVAARARATTWRPRSASAWRRATSRSRSARRAPSTPSATRPPPTRPGRSPASPTPPAGSCRSCARSTPRKVTDAWPACSASTSTSSTRWRWRARPAPAGSSLLPYLDGERTPEPARRRPACWPGCDRTSSREQLARRRLRGRGVRAARRPRRAAASVAETDAGRLVLVGGGARSPAYRQLLADLAGRAVTVPAELEHVAAGACVQAAAVLHQRPPEQVSAAWDLSAGTVVEPGPGGVGRGRRARRLRRPPRRRSLTVADPPDPPRGRSNRRPLGDFGAPWRHEVARTLRVRADVRPRSLAGWTIPSPCSACPRRRRSTTCGRPGGGWPSRSTPTTAATRRGCGRSTGPSTSR